MIAILLLTYQSHPERTVYALRTVNNLLGMLHYDGKVAAQNLDFCWYIADNGSPKEHVKVLLDKLKHENVVGYHNEPLNCGQSWNKGLIECYKHSAKVLVMEDDWELPRPFDIAKYDKVLEDNHDVGCVRFGSLPVGKNCKIVGYNHSFFLEMDMGTMHAFAGHPHLRHRRLNENAGFYFERKLTDAGAYELHFDAHVRRQDKVNVIWPLDLPDGWGAWHHFGTITTHEE